MTMKLQSEIVPKDIIFTIMCFLYGEDLTSFLKTCKRIKDIFCERKKLLYKVYFKKVDETTKNTLDDGSKVRIVYTLNPNQKQVFLSVLYIQGRIFSETEHNSDGILDGILRLYQGKTVDTEFLYRNGKKILTDKYFYIPCGYFIDRKDSEENYVDTISYKNGHIAEYNQLKGKNGRLQRRARTADERQRHGRQVEYFSNGVVKKEYFCINGNHDGEVIQKYRNGNLFCISNYKDDIPTGETVSYYKNGRPRHRTVYGIEGALTKIASKEMWYSNGNKRYLINYKNGVYNNLCEYWRPDGSLKISIVYENGKIKDILFPLFINSRKKFLRKFKSIFY